MSQATRVLLIHDDIQQSRRLAAALTLHEDWPVHAIGADDDAIWTALALPFDVILLAGAAGEAAYRRAAARQPSHGLGIPILRAAANGQDQAAAVLAHVREHLSKAGGPPRAQGWPIGDFLFMPQARRLAGPQQGQEIRLTQKESAILDYLYQAGDVAVPREQLLREIWGYNPRVTTHTLETHVYRLRRKLARGPAKGEVLLTENGGYRLCGERRP